RFDRREGAGAPTRQLSGPHPPSGVRHATAARRSRPRDGAARGLQYVPKLKRYTEPRQRCHSATARPMAKPRAAFRRPRRAAAGGGVMGRAKGGWRSVWARATEASSAPERMSIRPSKLAGKERQSAMREPPKRTARRSLHVPRNKTEPLVRAPKRY